MRNVAASTLVFVAVLIVSPIAGWAVTEPPCDTVCGCSTGCGRGCTVNGRITTCGLFGDCHSFCIHASTTSAGRGFLGDGTPMSPSERALPWAPACGATAPAQSAPSRSAPSRGAPSR